MTAKYRLVFMRALGDGISTPQRSAYVIKNYSLQALSKGWPEEKQEKK